MASLTLVQGPAGGGKSAVLRDMLRAGEVQLAADVTALWVALSGVERGPDGRYPVRQDDDPALLAALYVQAVIARHALEQGRDVAVTTSRAGQEDRWRRVADEAAAPFAVRTVDPGEDIVTARLSVGSDVPGVDPAETLTDDCRKAINRWYRQRRGR